RQPCSIQHYFPETNQHFSEAEDQGRARLGNYFHNLFRLLPALSTKLCSVPLFRRVVQWPHSVSLSGICFDYSFLVHDDFRPFDPPFNFQIKIRAKSNNIS
ncbi:hypothetical protein PMAYCL1PPCAC_11014, partial [Pristionchus mayeri]